MARLKENQYKEFPLQNLRKPILFVVDMINGFIKEGSLHDEAILDISKNIENLLKKIDASIFICDGHAPDSKEFCSYPLHCVKGTAESEVIEELRPYVKTKIYKNSTNTFMSPSFQDLLPTLKNHKDIILTGCCTDLCILQFALSLNSWLNEHNYKEQRVIVPVDCVDTYDIESIHDAKWWNFFSLKNMETNGILVVSKIGDQYE